MGIYAGIVSGTLQVAVMERLKMDSVLTALCRAIADGRVPSGTVMPYITVSDWIESPDDTLDRAGRVCTWQVHIWSAYEGFREAKIIGSRVAELLNRASLTLEEWTCWSCVLDNVATIDELGNIRHVVMRFKANAQEVLPT